MTTSGYLRLPFLFLAAAFPAYLAAVRADFVGTDYFGYISYFEMVAANANTIGDLGDLSVSFEYGFSVIVFVITRFTDDVEAISFGVYLIMAFSVLAGVTLLLPRRHVPLGYFLYLLGYWLVGFNIMRQALALPFFLIAMAFVLNSRKYLAISYIFVGALIHKSIVLVAPLFLLFDTKRIVSTRNNISVILIYSFALIFSDLLYSLLGYGVYLTDIYSDLKTSKFLWKPVQQLILLSPLLYFSWQYRGDARINFYSYLVIFSAMIFFVEYVQHLTIRLFLYFDAVSVFLGLSLYEMMGNKYYRYRNIFLAYIALYFFVYKFIYAFGSAGNVIPYALRSQ